MYLYIHTGAHVHTYMYHHMYPGTKVNNFLYNLYLSHTDTSTRRGYTFNPSSATICQYHQPESFTAEMFHIPAILHFFSLRIFSVIFFQWSISLKKLLAQKISSQNQVQVSIRSARTRTNGGPGKPWYLTRDWNISWRCLCMVWHRQDMAQSCQVFHGQKMEGLG